MKTLVTYFTASAGGRTKKLANTLAKAAGADLFEIVPEKPYTAADIKWTNPLSRCNKEWMGKKEVPVAGRIENFEEYDTVFIGFPIWYAVFPNVIGTFVKDYDWTGKKIALFATSGGSGMGKSADKLKPLLSGDCEIIASELFDAGATETELASWVKDITE